MDWTIFYPFPKTRVRTKHETETHFTWNWSSTRKRFIVKITQTFKPNSSTTQCNEVGWPRE